MNRRRFSARAPLVGVLVAVSCASGATLLTGCGPSESADTASAFDAEPTYSYTVRGTVVSLPGPTQELQVHHEHIPEFVNPRTGEINQNNDGTPGMREMVMPMPPRPGLDVSTLEVGQEVMITFGVWTGLDTPSGFAHRLTGYELIEASDEVSAEAHDADDADAPASTDGP